MTFLGYRCGGRLLLARQLASSDDARKQKDQQQKASQRAVKQARRREAIDGKVHEYGMRDWWLDAVAMLERNAKLSYKAKSGITFSRHRKRTLSTGVRASGSHKNEIVAPGVVRIIFLPAAVDLCLDKFEELRQVIQFEFERPPNAPFTERVPEQWSCRLDEARWRKHTDSIAELVRLMDERWREAAG